MEIDNEGVDIPQEVEFHDRSKRNREEDDPQVERELKRERLDALMEDCGDDISMGLFSGRHG